MGLSAITRKGWQTNPRKQGRDNFIASLVGIVVGTAILFFVEEDFFDTTYLISVLVVLLWGVFCLLLGRWLGKMQDDANIDQTK